MNAAYGGKVEAIDLFLKSGADVNMQSKVGVLVVDTQR